MIFVRARSAFSQLFLTIIGLLLLNQFGSVSCSFGMFPVRRSAKNKNTVKDPVLWFLFVFSTCTLTPVSNKNSLAFFSTSPLKKGDASCCSGWHMVLWPVREKMWNSLWQMGLIGPEMWLFIRSVSVRVADRHAAAELPAFTSASQGPCVCQKRAG